MNENYENQQPLTGEQTKEKTAAIEYITKGLLLDNINVKFICNNEGTDNKSVMYKFLNPFNRGDNDYYINSSIEIADDIDRMITDKFGDKISRHKMSFIRVIDYLSKLDYPLICVFFVKQLKQKYSRIVIPIVREENCIYLPKYLLQYKLSFYIDILNADMSDANLSNSRVYYWTEESYNNELLEVGKGSTIIKDLNPFFYKSIIHSLMPLYTYSKEYFDEVLCQCIDESYNIVDALILAIDRLSDGAYHGELQYTGKYYNINDLLTHIEDEIFIICSCSINLCVTICNGKLYVYDVLNQEDTDKIRRCILQSKIDFAIKIMPS